jgi:hypothetical protein
MDLISSKKLKNSGILFSLLLILIFVLFPYFLKGDLNFFPIFISFFISLISFWKPYLLEKPYKFWIKFGFILSKINSTLILGILFYFFITPAAMFRNFIKIFLNKKNKNKSFYKDVEYNIKSSFDDQY